MIFALHLPTAALFVPLIGAGLLGLAFFSRDLERTGVYLMVAGWGVYALTSPTAQFPVFLRSLSNAGFAVGAIMHAIAVRKRREAREPTRRVAVSSRMLVIYAAFVLIGCVASPFGPKNLVRGVQGLLIIGTAFYAVAIELTIPILTATFLAASANVLLTAISRKQEVDQFGNPTGRLAGDMQPNHLAFTAAEVLIGVIWMYPRDIRVKLPFYGRVSIKGPLLVLGLISLYVLYASESRTAWLAVVPAIVIAWFATPHPKGTRTKVVVYGFFLVLLLAPVAGPAVGHYLTRGQSEQQNLSLTGRADFWPLAVELIKERPIVGWGVNVILSPVGYKFQEVLPGVGQAHNAFLEAGLQSGVIGLTAYAVSLIALLVGSFRLARDDPLRMLVIAGAILTFIFAFTESSPAWFGDMFIVYVLSAAIYANRVRTIPAGRKAKAMRLGLT